MQRTDKGYPQAFTTEPKTRRLYWHKQVVVKTRATALQESFYPTKDVPYAAVQQRMATLLGIVDKASVLAYLGRPETTMTSKIDQLVTYRSSGNKVLKTHDFKRKLAAKKGYIEPFDLGYCYIVNGEWWIHWFHSEQTSLQSYQSEEEEQRQSKVDFSLSHIAIADNEKPEANEDVETTEKRESESLRERNFASESILHDSYYTHHTELLRKYEWSEST